MDDKHWRVCSICKKPIGFGEKYWRCSVSTCNRRNTDYAFCSVNCWDAHTPTMRHRNAWAEENMAPTREEWAKRRAEEAAAKEARISRAERDEGASARAEQVEVRMSKTEEAVLRETLIVASRLKKYIKDRSGLKTSDGVMVPLSDIVRVAADRAIRNAAAAGRSTVLERDVEASEDPSQSSER